MAVSTCTLRTGEGSGSLSGPIVFALGLVLEQEVHRHADQDDQYSGNGGGWTIHEQNRQDHDRADEVEGGNHRIAEGMVWALSLRPSLAQPKYGSDGQNVED